MSDLFEPARAARSTDPTTSHDAAASMDYAAGSQHHAILEVLRGEGIPLAAEQISDRCKLDYVAINRRLPELERGGLVARTDERHVNRSGRSAFKWRSSHGF